MTITVKNRYLGILPPHWRSERIKYVASINQNTLGENTDENLEIQYIDISAVDPHGRILEPQRMRFEEAPSRARRKVTYGDTIVSTVRTYLKAISFIDSTDDDLVCSTGFAVLTPKSCLHPTFLAYFARSTQFIDEVVARSVGVSYPAVNSSDVADIVCPIPPHNEQGLIASFLDEETAKLDQLVEKKQRLIELLQENRQALITQAVTKGLDPNVSMKDSGIPWLGEVPKNWTFKKLKHFVSTVKGFAFKSAEFEDSGVPVVKATDIKNYGISLDQRSFISQDNAGNYEKVRLSVGDIIMSTVGSWPDVPNSAVGQIGLIPSELDGALLNQNTVKLTNNKNDIVNRSFFWYLLTSINFRQYLDVGAHGTANQASLSLEYVLDFVAPIPPLEEQIKAAEHLDELTAKVDVAIDKLLIQIGKISLCRQALISAAVIGQIDVRQSAVEAEEVITS